MNDHEILRQLEVIRQRQDTILERIGYIAARMENLEAKHSELSGVLAGALSRQDETKKKSVRSFGLSKKSYSPA